MTRPLGLSLAAFAMCTVLAGVALNALNRTRLGQLEFYAWEVIGGKAHGDRYAAIGDIRIYYATFGSGRPILVLHGGLGSSMDMHYQIQALAATHFVIAPDSRAHGRSTDSDAPLSYKLMADDMVGLLDRVGISRVDVVGWSDGGVIGIDLAMRYPKRVGRLVVVGANYDVDGLVTMPVLETKIPPPPAFYWRNAPDRTHWPVLYRKVVTMWRTQPHYTLEDLDRIKAPTLVMAGEFDAIRRKHTEQLVRAIPGARLAIIAGTTHSVLGEKPDIANAAILRFLDE